MQFKYSYLILIFKKKSIWPIYVILIGDTTSGLSGSGNNDCKVELSLSRSPAIEPHQWIPRMPLFFLVVGLTPPTWNTVGVFETPPTERRSLVTFDPNLLNLTLITSRFVVVIIYSTLWHKTWSMQRPVSESNSTAMTC